MKDSLFLNAWSKCLTFDFGTTGFCRVLTFLLNKPIAIWTKGYERYRSTFSKSFFIRCFEWLLDRLVYVNCGLLLLLLITPHHYWNNVYCVLIAAMMTVLLAFRGIFKGESPFRVNRLGMLFFLFATYIVASIFFTQDLMVGVRQGLFYFSSFLIALNLVSSVKDMEDMKKVMGTLFIGCVFIGLYGVYQSIVGVPFEIAFTDLEINEGLPGRVFSTMENPNNLAEVLTLLLPLCIALILNLKKVRYQLLLSCMLLPALYVLLLTGSRSGWGAFAVAVFVCALLKDKRLLLAFIFCAVLAFISLPTVSPSTYKRVRTIFNKEDNSKKYRNIIYKTTKAMIRENYFLGIGQGVTNFTRNIANHYDFGPKPPVHSHNIYLQIWLESGVIALALFILYILNLMARAIYLRIKTTNEKQANILIALLSGIVGILVIGIVDYIWFYPRIMILFFSICALLSSALYLDQEKGEK